jgi:hypothetical protein
MADNIESKHIQNFSNADTFDGALINGIKVATASKFLNPSKKSGKGNSSTPRTAGSAPGMPGAGATAEDWENWNTGSNYHLGRVQSDRLHQFQVNTEAEGNAATLRQSEENARYIREQGGLDAASKRRQGDLNHGARLATKHGLSNLKAGADGGFEFGVATPVSAVPAGKGIAPGRQAKGAGTGTTKKTSTPRGPKPVFDMDGNQTHWAGGYPGKSTSSGTSTPAPKTPRAPRAPKSSASSTSSSGSMDSNFP